MSREILKYLSLNCLSVIKGKIVSIILIKKIFFWPPHVACGILVLWPGIKPTPSVLETQSLNLWTDREVQWCLLPHWANVGKSNNPPCLGHSKKRTPVICSVFTALMDQQLWGLWFSIATWKKNFFLMGQSSIKRRVVPNRTELLHDSLRPHGLYPSRRLFPWWFSRQEYWNGLSCPSPGENPNPGIEPRSPASHTDSLPSEPPGKPFHKVSSISLTAWPKP